MTSRRANGIDSRAQRERRSREAWAAKEALLEDDLCGMGPPELPEADEGAPHAAPPIVADLSLDAMPSSIYAVPASVVFSRDGSGDAAGRSERRRVLVRNCGASSVPVVVMRPQSQRYTVRPAVEGPHDSEDVATSLWDGAPAGAAVALRLIRPGEAHQFFVERAAPRSRADAADDERTPAALYIFTRYFPLRVPLLIEGGKAAPPPSPRRGGPLRETQPRSMLSVCGPPPKLFETIVRRARTGGRADAVAPQQVRAPRPAARPRSPQSPPQSSSSNAASKLNSDDGEEEEEEGGEAAPACAPSPQSQSQSDAQPEQRDSSRFVSRVDDAAAARALLTAMRAKRSTARALGATQPSAPVPSRAQQHAEEAELAALRDPLQQTAERRRKQRASAAPAAAPAARSRASEGAGDGADAEWVEREYRRRLEAAANADAARRSKKAAAKARKQAKAKKVGSSGSLGLAESAATGKGASLRVSVKPGQRLRIAPPRRTRGGRT